MAIIKKFRIKSFKEIKSIIELKNISVSYNKRQIIDNLNLKINKGEILGMLGPNGVGKSTIYHLIIGLIKPNYGEIIINGEKANEVPIYERSIKYSIGYVPQYGGYFQNMTIFENLMSVAEIQIKQKHLRESRINNLISKFELENVSKLKARYLSGGQRKKLVIAMALINNPKVLILDEPFAALDILSIKMLQQIIVNLQTLDNITICLCDHQARDLLICVDKAIVLSNGKIVADGTPQELVEDANAKSAYFGDEFKFN